MPRVAVAPVKRAPAARVAVAAAPRARAPPATSSRRAPIAGARRTSNGDAAAQRKVAQLTRDVRDMQQTIEELETERNMYYAKLRAVEILCQDMESEHPDVIKPILDRLYSEEAQTDVAAVVAAASVDAGRESEDEEEIEINM